MVNTMFQTLAPYPAASRPVGQQISSYDAYQIPVSIVECEADVT